MTEKNNSVTWKQAKQKSEDFKDYWYSHRAGKIMEEITRDNSIYFRNDKKWVSVYATISAMRKRLEEIREEQYNFYKLESRIEELENQLPMTKTEQIKNELVNTDQSQKEIAEEFEVTEAHVSQIKSEVRQDL
ncbi:MAG: hypothetical protein V5A72_02675 [Candidatus Nanohaloarchaea archaeon]